MVFLFTKTFCISTVQILPLHALRAVGGSLYLTGAILMTYNLIKTARSGTFIANEPAEAAPLAKNYVAKSGGSALLGVGAQAEFYLLLWH